MLVCGMRCRWSEVVDYLELYFNTGLHKNQICFNREYCI